MIRAGGKVAALAGFCGWLAGCGAGAVRDDPPPAPIRAESGWFACVEDADCVMVRDSTCALASVNTQYVEAFAQYVRYELFQMTKPRPCDKTRPIEYAALCIDSRCSSRREPAK